MSMNHPHLDRNTIRQIIQKAELQILEATGMEVQLRMHVLEQYGYCNRVQDAICEVLDVRWEEVQGGSKKHKLSNARMIFVHLVYQPRSSMYNSVHVGTMINKDHSTVLYYSKKAKYLLSVYDSRLQNTLELIQQKINQHERN